MSDKLTDAIKLYIEERFREEKKVSDQDYAIKLVERVVFYGLGMVGITALGALLKLIFLPSL